MYINISVLLKNQSCKPPMGFTDTGACSPSVDASERRDAPSSGTTNGNRTRDLSVKGTRLNPLTMAAFAGF